jgi:hypothetical protein
VGIAHAFGARRKVANSLGMDVQAILLSDNDMVQKTSEFVKNVYRI